MPRDAKPPQTMQDLVEETEAERALATSQQTTHDVRVAAVEAALRQWASEQTPKRGGHDWVMREPGLPTCTTCGMSLGMHNAFHFVVDPDPGVICGSLMCVPIGAIPCPRRRLTWKDALSLAFGEPIEGAER